MLVVAHSFFTSNVRNIPSGSGTTPTAVPCAPLTMPRRVEIFDRTAVGMFCVYISRPGPLMFELSCTSNNLSTSRLRVPLAFFHRVWRAGKINIFCSRVCANLSICRQLIRYRSLFVCTIQVLIRSRHDSNYITTLVFSKSTSAWVIVAFLACCNN